MNKAYYLIIFFSFGINSVYSQSTWSINGGLSYTNVIHSLNGQQVVYTHKPNSPLWNIGFKIGISKYFFQNERFSLTSGIGTVLRGDKDSRLILLPEMKLASLRLIYLSVPLTVNYKILNQNILNLKAGISGDYLLWQNKLVGHLTYFPIESFLDKWEVSAHMGFSFIINNKLSLDILYSQGLTNIYNTETPNAIWSYKNQAFESSINYRL